MDVKSVVIRDSEYATVEVAHGRGAYAFDGGLKSSLGMERGKTYTLIAVKHPEPPKEAERKECRKILREGLDSSHYVLCENCGHPGGLGDKSCSRCKSQFTGTISWAHFAKRDRSGVR